MKKNFQLLTCISSFNLFKKLGVWSLLFVFTFLANSSIAQVTINFESLNTGTIPTNPYADPLGFKFTGLNTAGANEPLSVSSVHATKSIINTNWGSQVVLQKTDGTAFSLISFAYHGDPWDGTADATVTGTYASGGTITSSFTGGANFATLMLNWNGLSKVVINYNGGVNGSYGLLDNFVVSSGTTTYTVNTTASNGSVTKSPNQATYNSGTNVTLTATANSGYTFSGWSGDASGSANPLSVTVNANKNITANFTTASANAVTARGQNIPNEGIDKLVDGNLNSKWLDFSATSWVQFSYSSAKTWNQYNVTSGNDAPERDPKNWTIQGSNDGISWVTLDTRTNQTWSARNQTNSFVFSNSNSYSYYKWVISANGSGLIIQASEFSFSSGTTGNYTLNIAGANGSVSKSPDQTTYSSGSNVTLTATPNSGYTFGSWSGDATGTANPLSVSMTTNKNITANFIQNPASTYTVNVTATNGAVAKSPNQATYTSGTNVQLTATANSGYSFTGWSGDASGSSNPLSITVDANKSINANFTAIGGSGLLDPNATPSTVALWNYLKSVNGNKMLTGVWTEEQYGGNTEVVRCTGKMPAIWGNDMNTWYNSRTNPMWNQVWAGNIDGFKTAYNRGQIIQVNWHWQNPATLNNGVYALLPKGEGMGAWSSLTLQQWNDIITPGTALYNTMIEDLDYHVTGFLKKLVDNTGKAIPIIFRPLHEIDGGWFWWTCASDPSKTAALYKIIQNRIINFHGMHNLIWVYNPGVICDGGSWPPYNTSEYPRRKAFYPGDAYCDITGIDLYDFDPIHRGYYNTTPAKTYRDAWNVMKAIAPTKMTALCEAEALPDAAKCFNDPTYAPWLYCLPWYAKEIDQCAWNNIQFNSAYVINAGDFAQMRSTPKPPISAATLSPELPTSFLIYPNPASQKVNVRLPFKSSTVLISVFDLTGKEVIQSKVYTGDNGLFQLNTSNLSNGIYNIRITNKTKTISAKLTILR